MALLELGRSRATERKQCAFGDRGIAFGDLERVAATVDQLDPERKSPFVDQPPRSIETNVVRLAAHCLAEQSSKFIGGRRHCEAGGVEQAFEQLWAPGELVGERGGVSKQFCQKSR